MERVCDEKSGERRGDQLKIATEPVACFRKIFAAQIPPSPQCDQGSAAIFTLKPQCDQGSAAIFTLKLQCDQAGAAVAKPKPQCD
jgi:hypothetical protein